MTNCSISLSRVLDFDLIYRFFFKGSAFLKKIFFQTFLKLFLIKSLFRKTYTLFDFFLFTLIA